MIDPQTDPATRNYDSSVSVCVCVSWIILLIYLRLVFWECVGSSIHNPFQLIFRWIDCVDEMSPKPIRIVLVEKAFHHHHHLGKCWNWEICYSIKFLIAVFKGQTRTIACAQRLCSLIKQTGVFEFNYELGGWDGVKSSSDFECVGILCECRNATQSSSELPTQNGAWRGASDYVHEFD